LAKAIVRGDIRAVLEFVLTQKEKRVPVSYFDAPFDTDNRKLVAFAIYHHLKNPGDADRLKILHVLAKSVPPKQHGLKTAIKGITGHGIAHVAASHARTTGNFNGVRHRNTANTSQGLVFPGFNTYAKNTNSRGKRARNYAMPAVRNHLNRTYHANRPSTSRGNVSQRSVNEMMAMLNRTRV
jgi:hypothetical protein